MKKIIKAVIIIAFLGLAIFGIVYHIQKSNKTLELKFMGVYEKRRSIMLYIKNESSKDITLHASEISFNYNGKIYTGDYLTSKNSNTLVLDVNISSNKDGNIIVIFKDISIDLTQQTFYYKDTKIN